MFQVFLGTFENDFSGFGNDFPIIFINYISYTQLQIFKNDMPPFIRSTFLITLKFKIHKSQNNPMKDIFKKLNCVDSFCVWVQRSYKIFRLWFDFLSIKNIGYGVSIRKNVSFLTNLANARSLSLLIRKYVHLTLKIVFIFIQYREF